MRSIRSTTRAASTLTAAGAVCLVVGTTIVLGAVTLLPGQCAAQNAGQVAEKPSPAWATWLTVVGGTTTLGAGGGALALSYQRAHIVWSLRASVSADGGPCTDCLPDAGDFGAMVSYATAAGHPLHASAGAGIGYAYYPNQSGVGIPVELQVAWRPTRVVGLGLYGWGNSLGPHGGLGIALHFGRLR